MESKNKKFLPKAEYPGGMKAMSKFIFDNMIYPETALKDKIHGMVALRLEIDYQGQVKFVKVLSGLRSDCNEEAIRLAKMLIFHVGKVHNVKISCFKNINIHFNLPLPSEQTTTVQYIITSTSLKDSEQQGMNYTYTVIL